LGILEIMAIHFERLLTPNLSGILKIARTSFFVSILKHGCAAFSCRAFRPNVLNCRLRSGCASLDRLAVDA
jgi:hypothetical protein